MEEEIGKPLPGGVLTSDQLEEVEEEGTGMGDDLDESPMRPK